MAIVNENFDRYAYFFVVNISNQVKSIIHFLRYSKTPKMTFI